MRSRTSASTRASVRRLGEVGDQHPGRDAALLREALRQGLEALGAPRHEHQVVLVPGEALGEGATDARGGTGHEGAATGAAGFFLHAP